MHAVIAILAALVAPRDRPARAPTSTCRSPTACSRSWRCRSTSTSPPATSPGRGHGLLTGRYACYDTYQTRRRQVARGRRHRAAGSGPTCAGCSGSSSGASTRPTTPCRTRSAPTSAPRSRPQTRDEWVGALGRRRHLRRSGAPVPRSCDEQSGARRADARDRRGDFRRSAAVARTARSCADGHDTVADADGFARDGRPSRDVTGVIA